MKGSSYEVLLLRPQGIADVLDMSKATRLSFSNSPSTKRSRISSEATRPT
jgi:hypothetical protein